MSTPDFADRWTPYLIYTVTTKQLREWFDRFGSNAMYDGCLWTPKAKRLVADLHEVKFVKI